MTMNTPDRHVPLWRKALKITLWTIMAAVLAVAAVIICAVGVLDSRHLTAIANRTANNLLDADVSIGRVELSLWGHMPFVRLEVDSVTVLSGPIMRLADHDRERLPAWADTLLTIDRFSGGINLAALLRNRIELHDVDFDGPGINIATLDESVSNYLIYASADTAASESGPLPDISINRFSINRPRPVRYHNAQTDEHFEVYLSSVSLSNTETPAYRLDIGGRLESPSLALYNLDRLSFGADGRMDWRPSSPTELELRDFRLRADFLEAVVNAHVDFGHDIVVRDYDLELGRMGIERICRVLPDSLRRAWQLTPDKFETDLAIRFAARSTAPFNLTTDSLPHADIELTIEPGRLRYGRSDFRSISGQVSASLHGNDPNLATFTATGLRVAGPATDLTLDATASEVLTDPLVRGTLRGHSELSRLPERLTALARGYLSGTLTADISFDGRLSMLSPERFHLLKVTGDIDAHRLYYLSADTSNMVTVHDACLKFGTNTRISSDGHVADSLLTAVIRVDSAALLHNIYSMRLTGLTLGVGADNRRRSADTTVIVPMGGRLELGAFYFTSLSDTVVFNLRDASGRVSMTRYRGEMRRPMFELDLGISHMATGNSNTRFMLSNSHLHARAHKLPRRPMPPAVKATADSLRRANPYLPADSVYRYAVLKHRREHRKGAYPRIHPEYTEAEAEIINWGTSKTVRRLLLGWSIDGSLTAERAGVFTPYFPIRNRVRDFNLTFNNDSVCLHNVRYKAGHSDFVLSGRITNLKRGFTSQGFRSPLKINFDVVSDTIDINELANSTFRGSAYAAADTVGRERHKFDLEALEAAEAAGDAQFEREVGRYVEGAPDSVAPLLIPRNVDIRLDMRADHVLYSDLMFHDFSGLLLAYRGAINLHHLTAASDAGSLNLSALYSAPTARDLKFGFGLQVDDFNLEKFTRLVPAVDSIMPLLRDVSGTVDADIAATCDLDREMNLLLPTLSAAIRLQGDSLALIDKETYRTIGKWLLFKDRQSNIIDHMNVEATISDNHMELYPFEFDIDRYKLGVQGYNDLALNFDYHIAVLKSPLPFKFGINIKGNPDKYKIRLGRARFKRQEAARTVSIVDTARVNLLRQIENIFRRGVSGSQFARVNVAPTPEAASIDLEADTISHADSLVFIREGLLPAPPAPEGDKTDKDRKPGRKRGKKPKDKPTSMTDGVLPRQPRPQHHT